MKIHHIGYLVQDIDRSIHTFLKWGIGRLVGNIIFDKERLLDIAFISAGEMLIELVSPREGSVDIGEGLKQLKNTPYHLCFECDHIQKTIDRLVMDDKCILIKEPQPAIAIDGRNVAFLYSGEIGLFEIIEMDK